jgi:hypothetical protein
MPVDLASFASSTLSFAVAISWSEVAREVIHRLRLAAPGEPGVALEASLAYALVVTLTAVLVVALAEWGGRRLTVSSGFPGHSAKERASGQKPPVSG